MDRLFKDFKKKWGPWITWAGMMIYAIMPGGSVILLLLFLIFPDLFRAEIKNLWETTKKMLRKIGIIKS